MTDLSKYENPNKYMARALIGAVYDIKRLEAEKAELEAHNTELTTELTKAIEMLEDIWAKVRSSTGDVVIDDYYKSDFFQQFEYRKHDYEDLAKASLTRAKGGGVMRNKYPGNCYRCGKLVEAGDGHFERFKGGWRTQHATCALIHRAKKIADHTARAKGGAE